MKLKIAGSGGMFLIPNPFCKCPVCQEARTKRGRYERLGPSLYIEDIGMLIDTPEDIAGRVFPGLIIFPSPTRILTIRGACESWSRWVMTALPAREHLYSS